VIWQHLSCDALRTNTKSLTPLRTSSRGIMWSLPSPAYIGFGHGGVDVVLMWVGLYSL
jgi:hypothetical protein